jgi:hypothetical protein
VDEFEPKGHVLHNVPGYVWEWYSNWTHSSSTCRPKPRKPRRRICRLEGCEDDHGELPPSSEESDLQKRPQRKVSSLVGTHNMHRTRAPKQKGQ